MEDKALILLAERDPYAAEFTEHFLRTEGYEVRVVFSAEDALAASAQDPPPDLAIVDLLISGAQGKRLCSQLLEIDRLPILTVSSLASAETAFAVGASAFLQKPVGPLELIATVQSLLEPRTPTSEEER